MGKSNQVLNHRKRSEALSVSFIASSSHFSNIARAPLAVVLAARSKCEKISQLLLWQGHKTFDAASDEFSWGRVNGMRATWPAYWRHETKLQPPHTYRWQCRRSNVEFKNSAPVRAL
jgi:hypothetical protein